MAEYSFLWNGTTTGDAIDNAPYDRELFNQWFSFAANSDYSLYAGVLPAYLEDLEVKVFGSDAYNAVIIKPGAALVKDYLYVNDEDVIFTVPAPTEGEFKAVSTSDRRYDSIILRIIYATQTIRVAYLEGVPASNPVLPTLIQTDEIYEVYLAHIYVDKLIYVATDSKVVDLRRFISTNQNDYATLSQNLHKNSEFLAFSYGAASGYTQPPENWDLEGTITFNATVAGVRPATRGNQYYIEVTSVNANSSNYAYTKVSIPKGTRTFTLLSTGYTDTTGAIGVLNISGIGSTGIETTKTFTMGFVGNSTFNTSTTYWKTFTFDETDIEYLIVKLYVESSTGVANVKVRLGSLVVTPGYHPGTIRKIHETLLFERGLTDTSWDGDAKSSGSTTITLGFAGSFQGGIYEGVSAVICRVKARDSASAASATPYVELRDLNNIVYGRLHLNYVPNDYYRETVITVPVNRNTITRTSNVPSFIITVAATGAATCDVTVEIIGVIT